MRILRQALAFFISMRPDRWAVADMLLVKFLDQLGATKGVG